MDLNLKKVIEKYGVNKNLLAAHLWPKYKDQYTKLHRVLRGEHKITGDELYRLSEYIGVPMTELYGIPKWKLNLNGDHRIHFYFCGLKCGEYDRTEGVMYLEGMKEKTMKIESDKPFTEFMAAIEDMMMS